jgi:hypothetical protein
MGEEEEDREEVGNILKEVREGAAEEAEQGSESKKMQLLLNSV